ncbi:hypothetical protein BH20ACT24_BH20ACT24_16590 [soil metagenome]
MKDARAAEQRGLSMSLTEHRIAPGGAADGFAGRSAAHVLKSTLEWYLEATSSMRLMPDFLIIGAQRSGTTSLYRYLAQHSQVVPTLLSKGVHYFDTNHGRGLAWYRGHFPSVPYRAYARIRRGTTVLTGEGSPYYLFHPHAPGRVAQALPSAKLIVMVREPASRAYSHYQHEVSGGFEALPTFEEAIEAEPARLRGEVERMMAEPLHVSFAHQHHSYLARGFYLEQLEAWTSLFAREQILVLESGRFFSEPERWYGRTLDFLGLPHQPLRRYRAYNAHAYPPMASTTRARLRALYREGNERLYHFLGEDFGWG